jgi:hypothetical protein
MNGYLLLRDNKQTGPYSKEEIIAKGFKPYDLIWAEGKARVGVIRVNCRNSLHMRPWWKSSHLIDSLKNPLLQQRLFLILQSIIMYQLIRSDY